jgi:N-acyl homoserine lactone hydrolase
MTSSATARWYAFPLPATPPDITLRVRIGADEVVMTGDACYLRRTLDNFHLPTAMYDREQMLESIRRLRALRDGGAMIITGHDPDLWKTIPQAPDRLAVVRPGG